MKVGLFIPCYVDQFYPQVGVATLRLLESVGCEVEFPMQQTCCGQPLANSGMEQEAIPIYQHFVETFQAYEYVVAPSSSCVYHVNHHYDVMPQNETVKDVRNKTLDVCAFLVDVLQIKDLTASFPYKVGLHQSCHGLRGLRMAKSSELRTPSYSKWEQLLSMVSDIELITLDRPDECCGFGGTFSIFEAAVSTKMGTDKINDHQRNGAQYITSGDMSCLMHMDGLLKRTKSKTKVIHMVEILAGHLVSKEEMLT
ncbi:MAG: (Fe-S)-binding protein [Saprospiraceae bacterium]|nr:(Fe-S)-binding protein [Saprospiraceae bacterium]